MTARFVSHSHSVSYCGSPAAACTSARIIPEMDTAVNLVVSICVIISMIPLLGIILCGLIT